MSATQEQPDKAASVNQDHEFTGNIYIFHAFDVGDDIDLESIKESDTLISRPLVLPKYFKNYHIPLTVELPHPHTSSKCTSAKIHNFGALSLTYKMPFQGTLEEIRNILEETDNKYQEQSVNDVGELFKNIKSNITHPKFFHTRSSYFIVQIDTQPGVIGAQQLKQQFGGIIASMLRFETKTLSELQKNDVLESSVGYFKGDFIVIDTEAAFVYDADYEETLGFFEFANIQQLELQYFDRVLDQQLSVLYEGKVKKVPLKAYLPFVGTHSKSPVDDLSKLRVDISVITERLESSIRLVGEPYFSELYTILEDKLDLKNWKDSIEKKLSIIHDIRSIMQHKIDGTREDMLTISIIILILIELLVALVH